MPGLAALKTNMTIVYEVLSGLQAVAPGLELMFCSERWMYLVRVSTLCSSPSLVESSK